MGYNYKRIYIILGIFLLVSVFVGGTLGFYQWTTSSSQKTNVVFTVEQDYSCAADGGGDITSGTLMPTTSCLHSEYAIQREIIVTPTINGNTTISMDLWLKINKIGSGLSNSENLKYALTTNASSCTEDVVTEGKFYGKTSTTGNNQLPLLSEKEYSATAEEKYYLYIWMDSAESNPNTLNQTLSLSLGGSCTDKQNETNTQTTDGPVLDSGMIPVTISDDGTVTTILSSDSSWYNYENKEWANAVLVNSSSRSNYQNTTGVTVNSSDILAYYVWIPRYKYQVWTTSTSSQGNEQEIDIVFESKTDPYSVATTVGQYQTHPAFWWDNDNDGIVSSDELISGIWVGKFEATGSADTPTILPNVTSLKNQYVGMQFQTALKFSGGTLTDVIVTFTGSDTYGLSSSTNSHMMKNREWGAVAYLSHSKYGINGKIRINNDRSETTGCGASTADASSPIDCEIVYGGATEYPQSTTGNITGVYDMSGGTEEYVMGNYNNISSLGGFGTFPKLKYYDLYLSSQFTGGYGSNNNFCTLVTCGGHALYETANWYGASGYFVNAGGPWFGRGGSSYSGANLGVFNSDAYDGTSSTSISWRSVLSSESGA